MKTINKPLLKLPSRRSFCGGVVASLATRLFASPPRQDLSSAFVLVATADRQRILRSAKRYVSLEPKTIIAFPSERSPGGPHDFFSQADYFWPNPADPAGPYINRDGQSNPDNFQGHRKAMIAFSVQMPALTSAWLLTRDPQYGRRAADHLRAWFIEPSTAMNPNLEYSQGVQGVSTGRSFGIIDTLHLVEVARAASHIKHDFLETHEQNGLREWFRRYLEWMKNSKKGIAERDAANNHGTCWALQAAEFARLLEDEDTREQIRIQYRQVFVPNQLGLDGSFPKELLRTKPYSYSIFNLDVMTTLCQSLSTSSNNLFSFVMSDGRGICKAAEFLYPYLEDKSRWPYAKDVQHFDALPVRSPSLLFCGLSCNHPEYISLWQRMNPDPTDPEIIRNYPIRQPLLWMS